MFSDDKKSRARFVAIEKIEHLRRNRGIRSIVKGERQLARRIRAANSRAKELRARIGRSAGAQTCSRRGQEGGRLRSGLSSLATLWLDYSPRKLALTFDDGPNPAITPKMLDLLDRYKARATFFVIGKHARECPELLTETAARGHVIGNHTDAHPNLFWLKPDRITVELRCCNFSIIAATGAPPKWFRPPFGFRNPWVVPAARELNQRVVMW